MALPGCCVWLGHLGGIFILRFVFTLVVGWCFWCLTRTITALLKNKVCHGSWNQILEPRSENSWEQQGRGSKWQGRLWCSEMQGVPHLSSFPGSWIEGKAISCFESCYKYRKKWRQRKRTETNPEGLSAWFQTIPALSSVEKVWSRISYCCSFSLL